MNDSPEHVEEEYLEARRVLLDALGVLEEHLDNLILIGAQAVYHHTGDSDLNVPLFTTDADLAIDTRDLAESPEIGDALAAAGFTPGSNPGHWVSSSEVAVDLMVAPHQSGTTKRTARAARLAPHTKKTARIARGLEPALVDNRIALIGALSLDDDREFQLRIAGPAALLVAKGIKIGERLEQADRQPDRLEEKDALDVFRILQEIDTDELVAGFETHKSDKEAWAVSVEALDIYREHASSPEATITQLAAAAALDDPTVAPAFATLIQDLFDALDSREK